MNIDEKKCLNASKLNPTMYYIDNIFYEKKGFYSKNTEVTKLKNQTRYFSTLANDKNHTTILIVQKSQVQYSLKIKEWNATYST